MQVQTFADVFDALADTPTEATDLKTRSDLLSALTDRLDKLRRGKISRFSRDDLVSLTVAAEAT